MEDLDSLCDLYGGFEHVQGPAGNFSMKKGGKMWIKQSGTQIKDKCYVSVDYRNFAAEDESSYIEALKEFSDSGRPSMETGFHSLLGKYVLHSHPLCLTAILCHENSREIVADLFKGFDYHYVPTFLPSNELYQYIKSLPNRPSILFLENHGVVVHSWRPDIVRHFYGLILEKSRKWIRETMGKLNMNSKGYLTPDHYVFRDSDEKWYLEMSAHYVWLKSVWKLRGLSEDYLAALDEMELEKQRK